MSKKTKIAGVDTPYTVTDLGKILDGFIKDGDWENKACLDYFTSECNNDTQILNEEFVVYSTTTFGSNEGIYTDFWIKDSRRKWRYCLLTAKTLHRSKDAFMKMNEMAGNVCYKFNRFVNNNIDNFIWNGFDVSYTTPDGKEVPYCWCGSLERVAINAKELRERHGDTIKIYYVQKSTRKKHEYKF